MIRRAQRVMIQGTMSGAGKSFLCTALCRIFRQNGYRVAPFKSQNMSLNSAVTPDGLEIGRAQAVQAQAAGIPPDVRMNPVLLKPSSDTGSQLIVMGRPRGSFTAAEYMRHKTTLLPEILAAYESLAAEYDVIVIEGAGSPAEINLRGGDIVNMGLAACVNAPVILTGDIDRGGVFAQLYGTVALLTPEERARVRGLLINKFRGDPDILRPGLTQLCDFTRIPILGVVPYLRARIDDEDSLSPILSRKRSGKPIDIAVIRLPRISNFTDFLPLDSHPLLGVRYVDSPADLSVRHTDSPIGPDTPDMIILPGTKSTVSDLLWLRRTGLEDMIITLAAHGTPVLCVCGGYQMAGERIDDPSGTESTLPTVQGMGLLPCRTTFGPWKILTRKKAMVTGGPMDGANVDGYEIHMGVTEAYGPGFSVSDDGETDGCCAGNVWGTYLHGLFDSGETTDKLAAFLCARKGIDFHTAADNHTKTQPLYQETQSAYQETQPAYQQTQPVCQETQSAYQQTQSVYQEQNRTAYQETQFDLLADGVRKSLDLDAVRRMMEEFA